MLQTKVHGSLRSQHAVCRPRQSADSRCSTPVPHQPTTLLQQPGAAAHFKSSAFARQVNTLRACPAAGNAPTLLSLEQLRIVTPVWFNTSMDIFNDAEAHKVSAVALMQQTHCSRLTGLLHAVSLDKDA